MSGIYPVLDEVRANGAVTSRDIADSFGWTVKKASTYLTRLHERGDIKRGELQRTGADGRPAILWWPK